MRRSNFGQNYCLKIVLILTSLVALGSFSAFAGKPEAATRKTKSKCTLGSEMAEMLNSSEAEKWLPGVGTPEGIERFRKACSEKLTQDECIKVTAALTLNGNEVKFKPTPCEWKSK